MARNEASQQKAGKGYNDREQELIKELVASRLEQKDELEYISFDDYDVPSPTQFSMLAKPAISIKYPHMTFSMSCLRLFEGAAHVLPMMHKTEPRLIVAPKAEEEYASFRWANNKDGKWATRAISSAGFISWVLYKMNWEKTQRYKALGYIANSKLGLVLVFNLGDAIAYSGKLIETVDPKTGATKKTRESFYPDKFRTSPGMSYDDYVSGHQMHIRDLKDYDIRTYSDYEQEEDDSGKKKNGSKK